MVGYPPEIHILVPDNLYVPSPKGLAIQRISDKEDPAWGSDKHIVPNHRPSMSGAKNRSHSA